MYKRQVSILVQFDGHVVGRVGVEIVVVVNLSSPLQLTPLQPLLSLVPLVLVLGLPLLLGLPVLLGPTGQDERSVRQGDAGVDLVATGCAALVRGSNILRCTGG